MDDISYATSKIVRLIRERLDELQEGMMAGSFTNYEDYRSAVGEVRGLTFIEQYIVELRSKAGDYDED
ncbi:MAG: hypothetical protein CME31_05915 [Gimesia sp.]|jgi:hypothetical protein|nr:hypothetical protein [Gimesia sp.]|tara:strand:+ start:1091 stop:1294 length:204 start_codon:yes stop_codon:yes gene_type:complete